TCMNRSLGSRPQAVKMSRGTVHALTPDHPPAVIPPGYNGQPTTDNRQEPARGAIASLEAQNSCLAGTERDGAPLGPAAHGRRMGSRTGSSQYSGPWATGRPIQPAKRGWSSGRYPLLGSHEP